MHARRHARSGLAVLLGAAALGWVPACRPAKPTETALPTPRVEPVATAPVKAEPPAPVARATAPVQLLPESTPLVVSIASVRHLLRVVAYERLIDRYRPQYDQIAAVIEQSAGYNLLDPNKWREIGVDPDGPIGMALFDTHAMAGSFFFTLSDPQRFRDYLDRVGGKIGGGLFPVYEDRGVVLASEAGAKTALVLRDGFAFFSFVERPSRARYDHARELASVDPARALTASTRWKAAVGAAPPRDLLAFLDLGAIVRAELESERRSAERSELSWEEAELQRLRDQGAPAEDIARWEQIIADHKQVEATMQARRAREREFISTIFGPLGPLVLELSLSDKAVEGTLRARTSEDALVRKVFEPRGAPPLAITAAGERVIFAVGASVRFSEALSLLDAALKADGDSLAKLFEHVKRDIGIDAAEAVNTLDGTGSFALTIKDAAALMADKGGRAIGFNLALGLRAPAEAQALLDAAAAKMPKEVRPVRKGRGLTVTIPDWRAVHVAIAGNALAMSTDPEFLRRVERGVGGSLDRALPAATVPVVTSREAAGVFFMDYLAPMGLFMSRSVDFRTAVVDSQPYWRFPEVPHEKIDKVPQSAAFKSKLKVWRAADDKLRKAEDARERAQMKVVAAAAESVGALAASLRKTGDGLQIDGGQFFGPGGLARAIELGIDAASSRGEDSPEWQLYEERMKVEQELQDIRVRDIEKALGVQASSQ